MLDFRKVIKGYRNENLSISYGFLKNVSDKAVNIGQKRPMEGSIHKLIGWWLENFESESKVRFCYNLNLKNSPLNNQIVTLESLATENFRPCGSCGKLQQRCQRST